MSYLYSPTRWAGVATRERSMNLQRQILNTSFTLSRHRRRRAWDTCLSDGDAEGSCINEAFNFAVYTPSSPPILVISLGARQRMSAIVPIKPPTRP